MKTLIRAWEVVKYGPESDKFPTAYIERHIFQKEMTFAHRLIGKDFYDLLIDDLVNYGTLETWSPSKIYDFDVYVDYFGTVLKSLIADNSVNPCEDDGTNWEVAKKFKIDCYERLWTLYLRPYLAFYITSEVIDYPTYPSGAKGVTEWIDDNTGTKSASQKVFSLKKSKLMTDRAEILGNMIHYIQEQHKLEVCDFSKTKFIQDCKTTVNKPIKRFAFRKTYARIN